MRQKESDADYYKRAERDPRRGLGTWGRTRLLLCRLRELPYLRADVFMARRCVVAMPRLARIYNTRVVYVCGARSFVVLRVYSYTMVVVKWRRVSRGSCY